MHISRDERGSLAAAVGTGVLVILLVAAGAFGVWAFMGRQDYKNNTDQISAKAVAAALEKQKTELEAEFAEREKQPYETYQGPVEYGSLKLSYPKTWEAFVNTTGNAPIDGYIHPGYVPGTDAKTAFALRFQVLDSDYAAQLKSFDGQVKLGTVKVSPFRADAVPTILGSRIDGEVISKRSGIMVLIPIRDKTLKIWTEADQYKPDFETMLKSLSFSP